MWKPRRCPMQRRQHRVTGWRPARGETAWPYCHMGAGVGWEGWTQTQHKNDIWGLHPPCPDRPDSGSGKRGSPYLDKPTLGNIPLMFQCGGLMNTGVMVRHQDRIALVCVICSRGMQSIKCITLHTIREKEQYGGQGLDNVGRPLPGFLAFQNVQRQSEEFPTPCKQMKANPESGKALPSCSCLRRQAPTKEIRKPFYQTQFALASLKRLPILTKLNKHNCMSGRGGFSHP